MVNLSHSSLLTFLFNYFYLIIKYIYQKCRCPLNISQVESSSLKYLSTFLRKEAIVILVTFYFILFLFSFFFLKNCVNNSSHYSCSYIHIAVRRCFDAISQIYLLKRFSDRELVTISFVVVFNIKLYVVLKDPHLIP